MASNKMCIRDRCYDTPLYVTFNGAISIVNSGKIRIYNATNPVTPVDTIDMGCLLYTSRCV